MSYSDYVIPVLLAFVISRIVIPVSSREGRKYLWKSPEEKMSDGFQRERQNNLTLAGFSLSALALFLALTSNPSDPSKSLDIRDTTYFLSISLVSFVIAAYLYPYPLKMYVPYAADSLELVGLFCIGIALLLFFENNYANEIQIQTVYLALFLGIILIAARELHLYYGMFNPKEKA